MPAKIYMVPKETSNSNSNEVSYQIVPRSISDIQSQSLAAFAWILKTLQMAKLAWALSALCCPRVKLRTRGTTRAQLLKSDYLRSWLIRPPECFGNSLLWQKSKITVSISTKYLWRISWRWRINESTHLMIVTQSRIQERFFGYSRLMILLFSIAFILIFIDRRECVLIESCLIQERLSLQGKISKGKQER